MRRWLKILLIILFLLLMLYFLRYLIFRGIGSFLIVSDAPQKTEVMFVLSGSSFDRGTYAANLFNQGYAKRIVCTGGNEDYEVLAFGKKMYECELTRLAVLHSVKDSSLVDTLQRGTSTYEERNAVLAYCKQKGIKSCMIVTSPFHTRRVSWLFRSSLKKNGIDVIIIASKAHLYDADEWWKNEYGLIDVNNEYVKLLYYLFKYGPAAK